MRFLIGLLLAFNLYGACIHEGKFNLEAIEEINKNYKVFVWQKNSFKKFSEVKKRLDRARNYFIQYRHRDGLPKSDQYNRTYISYYGYRQLQSYIKTQTSRIQTLGYQVQVIGKSLQDRELYAIFPKNFDQNKKTVLMLGRHHGDEGTANWIIEGFIDHWLNENLADLQVIIYPMINPDGAESRSRYNSKGRDLNRSWRSEPEKSFDEIKIIHRHLDRFITGNENLVIALDMHGSFKKDFMYRVRKNYQGRDFFEKQGRFINELKSFDTFQNGKFEASNGDRGMARVRLIKGHNINALTHETPRDIKRQNSKRRTRQSLKDQGRAIYQTIVSLY